MYLPTIATIVRNVYYKALKLCFMYLNCDNSAVSSLCLTQK